MTTYRHDEFKARCQACGDFTPASGDTLCRPCWRTVPVALIDTYMVAWRTQDHMAQEQAMRACVAAARPPAKSMRARMRNWFATHRSAEQAVVDRQFPRSVALP